MTATVSAVPLPELLIELGPLGLSGAIGGGIVAVANHLFTSRRERGAWLEVGRSEHTGMMKICYLSRLQSSSPIELWAGEVEFE